MVWWQKCAVFLVASLRLLWVRFRLWQAGPSWLESKLYFVEPINYVEATSADHQYVAKLNEVVRLAARCQYRRSACLPTSIVLYEMLRPKGYAVRLKIGVNKTAQKLYSHAWVELDGQMINEPEHVAQQYTDLQEHCLQRNPYNKNRVANPKTEK